MEYRKANGQTFKRMNKKNLKILCLILARGGSKRIPNKNIKILGGKPLIAYTIECAKKSKYINRIIVTTDSDKIAKVAESYGVQVPFRRPANISKSDSSEFDAFIHVLEWLKENENYVPNIIVKLFSTSPFRKVESVDRAVKLLLSSPKADSVRSVCLCSEHPYKMWSIDKKNNFVKSFVSIKSKPAQAHTFAYHLLPQVYIQNASIDVVRTDVIYKKRSIIGDKIIPFVMDEFESIDINTPLDFMLAQEMIKAEQSGNIEPQGLQDIIPENLEVYAKYLTVNNNCIVCANKSRHLWAKFGSYKAVQCDECGFVWICPFLNNDGLNKYYQDYIGMRFNDEIKTKQRQVQYQIDRDFIQTHVSSGKVLDVGGSGGFFLNVLSNNFEKHGIELDAEAVKYTKSNYSFGDNYHRIDLQDAPYADCFFDLIIMRGVLEHLPDPLSALKKVARLLKKEGYFYIAATPNVNSFSANLYREKWNQFHPIRHIFYFDPRTLAKLCAFVGLKIIAKDFPYLETPYANVAQDHYKVLKAVEFKNNNQFSGVGRSPAFWGNMMNLIFRKES